MVFCPLFTQEARAFSPFSRSLMPQFGRVFDPSSTPHSFQGGSLFTHPVLFDFIFFSLLSQVCPAQSILFHPFLQRPGTPQFPFPVFIFFMDHGPLKMLSPPPVALDFIGSLPFSCSSLFRAKFFLFLCPCSPFHVFHSIMFLPTARKSSRAARLLSTVPPARVPPPAHPNWRMVKVPDGSPFRRLRPRCLPASFFFQS